MNDMTHISHTELFLSENLEFSVKKRVKKMSSLEEKQLGNELILE